MKWKVGQFLFATVPGHSEAITKKREGPKCFNMFSPTAGVTNTYWEEGKLIGKTYQRVGKPHKK